MARDMAPGFGIRMRGATGAHVQSYLSSDADDVNVVLVIAV